jgi:cell division ATPase FtsA
VASRKAHVAVSQNNCRNIRRFFRKCSLNVEDITTPLLV